MNSTQTPKERGFLEGLLSAWFSVMKYKVFIITSTIFATAGILAFSIMSIRLPPDASPLPNYYIARATLMVQPGESSFLSALFLGSSYESYEVGQAALRILRSRTLLDQLADDLDVKQRYGVAKKSSQRAVLLSRSVPYFDQKTGSLFIQYTDVDPVFATKAVNRMVTLLNDWFVAETGQAMLGRQTLLETKISEIEARIAELEEQIKRFQIQYGILSVTDLGASQAAMMADLRSQLILKDLQLKNYEIESKIEDPIVRRLKQERQNIVDLIEEIETGTRGEGRIIVPQSELPELSQKFTALSTELALQRSIQSALAQQYELQKLAGVGDSSFRVLELAEVPEVKAGPNRGQICITTVLITGILSVVLALLHGALHKVRLKMAGREAEN